MKSFFPPDWYWWTESRDRIYSSAAKGYVQPGDEALTLWMADGTNPQNWPRDENGDESDAEMNVVLAGFGQKLPVTKTASAKTST